MDKEQRRVAKGQLVAAMQEGHSWQTAAAKAGLQISQSNAYRLWLAVRKRGEAALEDGRHGHPIKLRGEVRTFLEDSCRETPSVPSSTLQAILRERFEPPCEYQPDQSRASCTWGKPPPQEPGAGKKTGVKEALSPQAGWQEGAGSLLLLAAAQQTGLLPRLETALSPSSLATEPSLRLAHLKPTTLRSQVLTLLFLEGAGLRRTWDLRGYTGNALAFLTGRPLAYGYRHTERFLAELAQVGADDTLTEALAVWTADLWQARLRVVGSPVPVFYIDGQTPCRLR